MKRLLFPALFTIALLLYLSGCQKPAQGPSAWIDQPLDGDIFPLEMLTFQAHASDLDGVESIEFFINQESKLVISAGGGRLGQAMMEWMPSSPGVYTISTQAADSQGHSGALASVTITITDQLAQTAPEPEIALEETLEVEEEEEPIQKAEEPVLPTGPRVIPGRVVNCRAQPGMDYPAVTWLESGQEAAITGRLADNSWYQVRHPESQVECWVMAAIVGVSGSLDGVSVMPAPAAAEQPASEPQSPQPAADTTAPTISAVYAAPNVIYQQGCAGETQTAVLTVEAQDDGGIATVEAAWSIGSKSGSVTLSKVAKNRFEATVGPINAAGTLSIYGSVVDKAGNWTPFILNVAVKCCIC
jgi:hypothetical protein